MVLSIRPMQWANLPELHQTPTLDDSDLDCLEEIQDVLSRHGKSARFAVHLAHVISSSRRAKSWSSGRTRTREFGRQAADRLHRSYRPPALSYFSNCHARTHRRADDPRIEQSLDAMRREFSGRE
jgi:hypothetical protein